MRRVRDVRVDDVGEAPQGRGGEEEGRRVAVLVVGVGGDLGGQRADQQTKTCIFHRGLVSKEC